MKMETNESSKEHASLIQVETDSLKKAEEGSMHKDTSGSPLVEKSDTSSDNDGDEHKEGGICSLVIKSKSGRFGCMLSLIILYFLAEVIVGHITNSLTLVADSFHMLSDAVSLVVGLVAMRMSKRTAEQPLRPLFSKQSYNNTFGWVRFEVLGALVNSTFLLALCISIFLEAIEKFSDTERVENPKLVLIVGGGGLLINIFGLIMFGGHAHAHGHDHGHDHEHDHDNHNHTDGHSNNHTDEVALSENNKQNGNVKSHSHDHGKNNKQQKTAEEQLNMKAVFLHVLGDALGSVIVMISALIIWLVPEDQNWTLYIDPGMSLLLVVIMIFTTVPLFKKSSMILLQTVPKHISLDIIRQKLADIPGIKEIHDLHIWQLTGDKIVATVHIHCSDVESYLFLVKKIKESLHEIGIHSTTVQPEFANNGNDIGCDMLCSEECLPKTCCGSTSDRILALKNPSETTVSNKFETISEVDPESSGLHLKEDDISESPIELKNFDNIKETENI